MYVCHESQTEGGADQNPVNSTTVCVLLHSPPPSVMTRIPSRSPISPSSHMSNDQGCWGSAARRRGNTTFPARTGICRTKPVRVWMYSVMNIQCQWCTVCVNGCTVSWMITWWKMFNSKRQRYVGTHVQFSSQEAHTHTQSHTHIHAHTHIYTWTGT